MLARIIGALMVGALLAACSALKLAYNNLPEVGYWWLDGYVDFDDAQTPRVREQLQQLLAWHRRHELPKVAVLLQQAQALAPDEITPKQACELLDAFRARLLTVAERGAPAAAELARSLNEAQLQQIERKYQKINAAYAEDWLDRSPTQQREKRFDQLLDRSEDFYGRLDAGQRDLLRQQVDRSAFDPREVDADRRRRQQEVLSLLRRVQAQQLPPRETQALIQAYVRQVTEPAPGPTATRQAAMMQEACDTVAVLHNRTSAAQRDKAARRLQAYANDLRQLAEVPRAPDTP